MTGPQKLGDTSRAESFVDFMLASNIRILPFDLDAARRFSQIRAIYRLSTPDAIHLACAAAEGVDVFLANDTQLPKLTIPGIVRIAHLNSDIFASLLP